MSGTSAWTVPEGVALAGVIATVVAPLAGALLAGTWLGRVAPRVLALSASGTTLVASIAVAAVRLTNTGAPLGWGPSLAGGRCVYLDNLAAILMPYAALVATAILLVAPRRILDGSAVRRTLVGLGSTVAVFATSHPVALVVLWAVTAQLTWRSTRVTPGGRGAARVFALYMSIAVACMAVGTLMLVADPPWGRASGVVGTCGGWLVAVAVMIRKGIVPFHSWYPALFSGAPMSTALLATQPQVAAYTAVRLLVGHAEAVPFELDVLSFLALVTAVYGGVLALSQRDLRGFIGALAMSQSALVLAGLSGTLPMELTGALCVWISSGLAITGIGLVTWALESRAGDIPLDTLQGRFWDAPTLAALFLLFGVASIGFPGTLSFVADDLIVSGSLEEHVAAGLLVIASTVLCGIAVMRCWFHVFGGPTGIDHPRHEILTRERIALTSLLAVLFGLGLWPGPLVRALDQAATEILRLTNPAHASDPISPSPHAPSSP